MIKSRLKKISNMSLFYKILVTFLCIMTPLFALSLLVNELGKSEVKRQISNSISMNTHYYFKSLEEELERIILAQQQFINDEDLIQLSFETPVLTEYQRTRAINQLVKRLHVLKDSSGYIQDVSLYIKAIDSTLMTSNRSTGDLSPAQEAEEIVEATRLSGSPMTWWKDRLYLNLHLSPLRALAATGQQAHFVQNIELSTDALRKALAAFPQEGAAILVNAHWQIHNDRYTAQLQPMLEQLAPYIAQEDHFTRPVKIGSDTYLAVYEKSYFLDTALLFYFPENIIVGQLKNYGLWSWLLIGCSLVIVILFSYGIYLLIHRPMQLLVKRFRSVEEGNLQIAAPLQRGDEFGYLFNRFDRTVQRLSQLIDELYVQKIRLQQSELKQLQMQIAPHFLYNSFFTLQHLIRNDENEAAQRVARNLGDYFRYITRNGQEEVSLGEEFKHVCAYVEIQKMRFANRIEVEADVLPLSLQALPVPRLILQPVVENAFEHGLDHVVAEGKLSLRFELRKDQLAFIVEENGTGMDQIELAGLVRKLTLGEEMETTGLINIHRRLKLRYGERGGIEVSRSVLGGLRVELFIPIEGENDDVSSADHR
ncbi:hypothetical protein B1748_02295 [Paenibacillus sp. MY03]|uniref:sensor histidine kinase n=1 Tax=Paenibacillus sp. MY03 TaxID=302980 RepID=UPI000B3CB71E|nr:histidine kinase [Paenibacillus sp. MY03]OUS78443.1 hypothetical protein B1748_02295 [Paenibacillus sp. MY03]